MFNSKTNTFFEKIEKLKKWSYSISKSALESEYLNSLPESYVGITGKTKEDLIEQLNLMQGCANNLYVKQSKEKENPILIDADFCQKNAICPLCASRVSFTRRQKLKESIKGAAQLHPYAYMITVTLQNRIDLDFGEMVKQIKRSWRRFILMGQIRKKGRSFGESRKFEAGFYSIELKRGENSKLPHVHLHAMVFTNEELNTDFNNGIDMAVKDNDGQEKIIRMSKFDIEWFFATKKQGYINKVDEIKHVPQKFITHNNQVKIKEYESITFEESVARQSIEILKYSSMLNELSGNDTVQILDETAGTRFFSTMRGFYGVMSEKENEYTDNSESLEDCNIYSYSTNKSGEYEKGSDVTDLIKENAKNNFVRSLYLSFQGTMIGQYRNFRSALRYSALHEYRGSKNDLQWLNLSNNTAKALNALKYRFRERISHLWEQYNRAIDNRSRIDFLESQKEAFKKNRSSFGGNPLLILKGIYENVDTYHWAFGGS